MSGRELFAEGRLTEAVAAQEAAVAEQPDDATLRLLLVELLTFAGELDAARSHLAIIESDDPAWPSAARSFRRLIRAERRRSQAIRKPAILPEPIPRHAQARWLSMKALCNENPEDAIRWVDRADRLAPEVRGFLDGQEFHDIRDADDRFGSVLEAFIQGRYIWFPWESVGRVKLEPDKYLLDRLFRPAEVRLKDGTEFAVHLPLVYPGSHEHGGEFAIGLQTDRVCPDDGPLRCVGGKLLLVQDDEVPLAECQMIEIR